ncbi:MAG: pantetheine-phosphate adenylyltransferase [Deltaproteobacteria bacterium]|nr:pantetheine-phosphate adenylyltransferase [Deltaproteobacteria bacterium]MCX7952575.1 pantetheine-phosphate adenylyltransferase [Deltaproteobacteria bacterium]
MLKAVFPGTFDPITVGHLDVLRRALKIFDRITIAIFENIQKKPLFPLEDRLAFISKSTQVFRTKVSVETFEGLLSEYCKKNQIRFVIKGLRALSDYEYETKMALINREINPDLETIFLVSPPEMATISSSVVRELLYFNGDISRYVPEKALQPIIAAYKKLQSGKLRNNN